MKYCKIIKHNSTDYSSRHVTLDKVYKITGVHPDRKDCFSIINDQGVTWWVGRIHRDSDDGLKFVRFYDYPPGTLPEVVSV